jgi:hypothetical protein
MLSAILDVRRSLRAEVEKIFPETEKGSGKHFLLHVWLWRIKSIFSIGFGLLSFGMILAYDPAI